MESLSVSRDHELNSVASRIVLDDADIVFHVAVGFGADIDALAGRLPFLVQPGKVGGIVLGSRCRSCPRYHSVHDVFHMLFKLPSRKDKIVPTILEAFIDNRIRERMCRTCSWRAGLTLWQGLNLVDVLGQLVTDLKASFCAQLFFFHEPDLH